MYLLSSLIVFFSGKDIFSEENVEKQGLTYYVTQSSAAAHQGWQLQCHVKRFGQKNAPLLKDEKYSQIKAAGRRGHEG